MKNIRDLYVLKQAQTYTHQPSTTGTREGQTEWPLITFTLMPSKTKTSKPRPRTRMDEGMRKKQKTVRQPVQMELDL
tara:strand:- start:41 stop:271 length:231 start_codon:yes stop_codon:yes gene_type:complete